jgi:hypothetical protein
MSEKGHYSSALLYTPAQFAYAVGGYTRIGGGAAVNQRFVFNFKEVDPVASTSKRRIVMKEFSYTVEMRHVASGERRHVPTEMFFYATTIPDINGYPTSSIPTGTSMVDVNNNMTMREGVYNVDFEAISTMYAAFDFNHDELPDIFTTALVAADMLEVKINFSFTYQYI